MRKSLFRLYGPFLAIAVVQALFIVAAPSTSPNRSAVDSIGGGGLSSAGFGAASGTSNGTVGASGSFGGTGSTGAGGSTAGTSIGGTSAGTSTGAGATSGGTALSGGTNAPADGAAGVADPGSPAAAAQGDTSHCVGEFQMDVLLDNPPCRATWPEGADNGGATYAGVTADSIKIVVFGAEANAAVDGVLATQGLAASPEEADAFYENWQRFFEKRYESYGRKVELIRYTGNCPTSPPDPAACKEAAREVIKMQPFMVVWQTPLYGSVFDEFARAGIISIGGWHFDNSYFVDRRPFRYDIFMDGTRSMEMIAEYYCKKMVGGNADHAGRIIHPSFPAGGARDAQPRKVGIITPEIDANLRTANYLADLIRQCGGGDSVIATYESNIERAQEQTDATTQKLIQEKVTTVIHIGDLIAPAFSTTGFSQQRYFPEYLIAGVQLLDYDVVGRLYNKEQMAHAFGIGHLAEPVPFDQSDVSRMFRDVEADTEPCAACNLPMGYMTMVANIIHGVGPNLNPLTVESYLLNSTPYGGGDELGTQRVEFGPGDYTAISDAREIYWSETKVSTIDGKPGAYISLNNARRYTLGGWDNSFDIPVPAQ